MIHFFIFKKIFWKGTTKMRRKTQKKVEPNVLEFQNPSTISEKRPSFLLEMIREGVDCALTVILLVSVLIAMFKHLQVPGYVEFAFVFKVIFWRESAENVIQWVKDILKSASQFKDRIAWKKLLSSKVASVAIWNFLYKLIF